MINKLWMEQRSADFSCKEPDTKFFMLWGPFGPCCNYSTLLWVWKQHGQQVNRWACISIRLCFSCLLYTLGWGNKPASFCSWDNAPTNWSTPARALKYFFVLSFENVTTLFWRAIAILRKNNVGGLALPDIKLYYKPTVIKTAWYKKIDQWNRVKSPEINPHLYRQLIYDKECKNIHGVKTVSSINGVEKIEPRYYTISKHKLNMDWRHKCEIKTIKLLEENTGSKLFNISLRNIFVDMSPWAREARIKWTNGTIKLKCFCTTQETTNKMKKQSTEWEKILTNDIPDKGLIFKKYEELIQHNTKIPQTVQLKNGWRTWADTSPRKTYRWPIGIWKDAQHH